jgi:hypothetical protein
LSSVDEETDCSSLIGALGPEEERESMCRYYIGDNFG